jgi:LmbE family N-acetylglucosaminyl deacetylase
VKPALLAFIAAIALSGTARAEEPATFTLPDDLEGRTILFVGAHPDDEWGLAPILAEACIDRGARCHFVVASEANSGGCLMTIGLKDFPECSRLRRREMENSAAQFGGTVEFLGLDDLFYAFNQTGMERTIAEWSEASGGRDALIGRFETILREQRPRIVFTLDPRHGSSCHPSHRATANLLLEARERLPERERPPVWLEQTSDLGASPAEEAIIEGGGYVGWPDTATETVWYDATRRLRDGRTGYDVMIQTRKAHASQFVTVASGEKVLDPEQAYRRTPLAPLPASVDADYCTALRLERPTLDIPENRARLERLLRDGA